MGAGKTSVGQELARRLEWDFVDLDAVIERFERASIGEIFSQSGQANFRRSETEALQRVLQQARGKPLVLAAGGGAFAQPQNQSELKTARAAIVFLSAPEEELWQRVNKQGEPLRPLLRDRRSFSSLLASRMPDFTKADVTVETAGRTPGQIATEIARRLSL
jgi:shikimate kinase